MWLRGGDRDGEANALAIEIPNAHIETGAPLPWSGRGNVLTAIGGAVLNLAGV